jgi:MYXO-CTERM domain-containing protein
MNFLATIVAATAVTGMATADLINPEIPTWRGDADTAFAQWDSFTSAAGGPNAAEQGGGWNLYNFGSGAIIASSGNLYGASGALNIHVYPAAAPLYNMQEAVVNISFAGNPIEVDNVRALVGTAEDGTYVIGTPEFRGGDGGFSPQTYAFTFDLSSAAFGFQSLSFFFDSELANSSLDAISIDVLGQAVPAPGVLALLGLAGLTSRRRR